MSVLALMFALAVSPSDVGRNNPAAWNWVRDSQICTLRQQINSAGDTVKVSRTPGNDETAIEISQKSQLNLRDRQVPTGAIKLNPGGDVPAEVYQHTADRRLHVYAVTQDPNFVEKFSHAVSLGISDGSSTAAAISLGFPAAAADALRSCEDEKMRAWEAGQDAAEPWENPDTKVWGLRVPRAIGDFLVLRALYETGGIRSCEIGTVMFGRQPDGTEVPAAMDLVRLAIPRRTYTQSHIDYVIEVCERVAERAHELPAYRIVDEPKALRHFTARFRPVG